MWTSGYRVSAKPPITSVAGNWMAMTQTVISIIMKAME